MNENNDNALLKGESLLKTHLRFNANNNNNSNNSNVQKGEIYNASNGIDKRPADLVRRFGDLYSMARLDTLDALDNVKELDQFFTSHTSSASSVSSSSSSNSSIIDGTSRTKSSSDELKNKLLFSVVVVSNFLLNSITYIQSHFTTLYIMFDFVSILHNSKTKHI